MILYMTAHEQIDFPSPHDTISSPTMKTSSFKCRVWGEVAQAMPRLDIGEVSLISVLSNLVKYVGLFGLYV